MITNPSLTTHAQLIALHHPSFDNIRLTTEKDSPASMHIITRNRLSDDPSAKRPQHRQCIMSKQIMAQTQTKVLLVKKLADK